MLAGVKYLEEYRINGGKRIYGQIKISGAKNAALPVLAASILSKGECLIENCPDIKDVRAMNDILTELGCSVKKSGDGICVNSSQLSSCCVKKELMKSMRSSVFLAGPLLAHLGRAVIYEPGGCRIGERPIDIHLEVLSKLGAEINHEDEKIVITSRRLKGTNIRLPFPSVGATENAISAAVLADGVTVIEGAAREPEIRDLQNFLNMCGARISGAGTGVITVTGVKELHGAQYGLMPDRIETGTFLAIAAVTGGRAFLEGGNLNHLWALKEILTYTGCKVMGSASGVEIKAPERLKGGIDVSTGPYPEFPTDMQPQMMAVLATAEGISRITETMFENRLGIAKELNKMGAEIEISGRNAIIKGVPDLHSGQLTAEDLRGGAALCIAAAAANGESVVKDISHIDRGYFDFERKLRRLGVDIQRIGI